MLPHWNFGKTGQEWSFFDIEAMSAYEILEIPYSIILEKVAVSRLVVLFILYFSCYSAAGFWVLAGSFLTLGIAMGFLGAVSVLRMNYWGIVFWGCVLFPQWIFYGLAGRRTVDFMEKRRKRTEFCKANVVPAFDWKVLAGFVKIFMITGIGIMAEVYINPFFLQFFLEFYLNR